MKKTKVWLVAVFISIGLAGCSSPASADSTKDMESLKAQLEVLQNENKELKNQLESMQQTEAETTMAETAKSDNKAGTVMALNEPGILGEWKITVTAAQMLDAVKNTYGSFKPSDGNKYFLVDVTIENTGKNANSFLPSFSVGDDVRAKIVYGDGYEFSATNLLGYSDDLHSTTVNPLSTKSGSIAFEIPDSVAGGEEELLIQFSAGYQELLIKAR